MEGCHDEFGSNSKACASNTLIAILRQKPDTVTQPEQFDWLMEKLFFGFIFNFDETPRGRTSMP